MTAEELYEKEFGNADSIPKESVIRLLRHFGKVLDVERNSAQQSKMDYSEVGVNDIANKWASYLPIGHIIEGRDAMVEDIYGLLNAHAKTIADKIINEQKSEMSMDMVRALQEFHTAFNLPQRDTPTIIPDNEFQLRHKIFTEEVDELYDAYQCNDIIGVTDAIIDCLYVLIGTAVQFGIANKLNACFAEVHRSNMSKLGDDGKPVMRKDGKVMKGPNFVRPDLNKVLAGPSDYSVQKSEIKMPTKEAIVQYFNNHFNCHADVIIGDYETTETAMTVDAVLKMIEWLRNQITER